MTAGVGSPVTSYTNLDYASMVEDLTRFAASECGLDLNITPTDFGVVIAKMVSYATEMLGYSQHRLVQESIAVLCSRMPNFRRIARSYGYTPPGATASTTTLRVTFDLGSGAPTTGAVSSHDKYTTDDGLVFQPVTDTSVGPGTGTTTVDVDGIQGDEVVDEALAVSTGRAGQRYTLNSTPVLDDTLVVSVNGTAWTRAENDVLALEEATAQKYALRWNADNTVVVCFGDGVNGAIPGFGLSITATYKFGGGDAGNVEPGAIRNVRSASDAKITGVTNTSRGIDGGPAMSLSEAQARLPLTLRANDRIVSDRDYGAVIVEQVAGIVKAYGLTVDADTVVVYAVPSGGGPLNSTLRAAIQAAVRPRRMGNRRLLLRDVVYADLVVTVDVVVDAQASASDTEVLAKAVVSDQYDLTSLDFARVLSLQGVYDLFASGNVRGVTRAVVREHRVAAYASSYPFAFPSGNGTASFIRTTTITVRREWRIVITSAGTPTTRGTFAVYERRVGRVSSLSSVTMTDESARLPESNGLVVSPAWSLVLNPYVASTASRTVIGNTLTSVTVSAGDLRDLGDVGDEYVLERVDGSSPGAIFHDVIVGATLAAAASLALPGSGWATGDYIRVYDSNGVVFHTQITGGTAGAYTVSDAIPALAAGAVADVRWVAYDGTVDFCVTRGATNFSNGDQLYVDTYGYCDDVRLRESVFPRLQAANLLVRTIGGRT